MNRHERRRQVAIAKQNKFVDDYVRHLGTDVHIVKYPDRYEDDRGRVMWQRVMWLLDRFDSAAGRAAVAR
jgi:hypothetical protein